MTCNWSLREDTDRVIVCPFTLTGALIVVAITAAMEDYLKVIYRLTEDGKRATTQAIAERMMVAAPSVTGMIKRLSEL